VRINRCSARCGGDPLRGADRACGNCCTDAPSCRVEIAAGRSARTVLAGSPTCCSSSRGLHAEGERGVPAGCAGSPTARRRALMLLHERYAEPWTLDSLRASRHLAHAAGGALPQLVGERRGLPDAWRITRAQTCCTAQGCRWRGGRHVATGRTRVLEAFRRVTRQPPGAWGGWLNPRGRRGDRSGDAPAVVSKPVRRGAPRSSRSLAP